jgi:ribose transport system substrate-binding protein
VRRRAVSSFVAIALLAAFPATTAGATARRSAHGRRAPVVIGVSLAGDSDAFWGAYVQYEKHFAEIDRVTLDGPLSADGIAAVQAAQIKALIHEHVRALLINPVDSAAIAASDAAAAKAHIPVVMLDVGPASGHVYAVVRVNNVLLGQQACEYLGSRANGVGAVAVLEGDLTSMNGIDRASGFVNCMANTFPKMTVLTYDTSWSSSTAVSDAVAAIGAYSDLKGIYCAFSGPDQGIISAIQAAGQSASVPLVETGGVPAELGLIRQGTLAAVASQPVNEYAEYGLQYAKDAVEHKDPPAVGSKTHAASIVNLNGSPEALLPSTFVTKANVNSKALWGNAYKPRA